MKRERAKTYSKLANFNIVDAKDLLFLGGSEFECWNPFSEEVGYSEDDASHQEGVEAAGEGV